MQRACALALLHHGETVIHNPGISKDDEAAMKIITQLGAKIISRSPEKIIIHSSGVQPVSDHLHCRESGLSCRMFTGIAALSKSKLKITGEGSLCTRPMHWFDQVLPQLGVNFSSNNGLLPLEINGPLLPKNIVVDGSKSSQYLTGLLMAMAAHAKEEIVITVNNLNSKPYAELTVQMMQYFGYNITHENFEKFIIKPTDHFSQSIEITIESDWSSAAFHIVSAAISGKLLLSGLNANSAQADKYILKVLKQCGASIEWLGKDLLIEKKELKPFVADCVQCPDLFPALTVLAAACNGTSRIEGIHRLASKESSRYDTLKEEFSKTGLQISRDGDVMLVEGRGSISSAETYSHHDHRIAMAMAIAALLTKEGMQVKEASSVAKSYPEFFRDLQSVGLSVALHYE